MLEFCLFHWICLDCGLLGVFNWCSVLFQVPYTIFGVQHVGLLFHTLLFHTLIRIVYLVGLP